jgi:hypothetical protein
MTFAVPDRALASRFASIALDNVAREYPGKLDHVMASAHDVRSPRELHPVFYGSFDWHSCVHMHWLLARLRRLDPALRDRPAIDATFDRHFTVAAVGAEAAYLDRPQSATFERTYGWAWLLKLAEELLRSPDADAARWSQRLAPLAGAFARRYVEHLPKAQWPLRHGMHANSAFGLAFALDYARTAGDAPLAQACTDAAFRWYADDRHYPAAWEPSGADFLSPALVEADLVRRVLPATAFADWLEGFLPGLAAGEPPSLFTPVVPADRSDGQIVHLDGLNLSRAACFRGIAAALPRRDPRAVAARDAADAHLAAGMAGLAAAEYAGAHWLATFAVLAMTGA